jgi:uncharacterized NAD-dependent epimerase/dehydratase family protein
LADPSTEDLVLTPIERPYLLFLGDAHDQLAAKTANGIARWRPEWCVGQFRLPGCQADVGLRDLGLEEAHHQGARTLVVGVANRGGVISGHWLDTLLQALDLGYDVASGLHNRLAEIPPLAQRGRAKGQRLIDVRYPDREFPVGTGRKRMGKRLLTVGTDCSVGKMFAALAMEREMKKRGIKCDFRATGQTGIFIAGQGVSVDAVVSDFVAGAAECLSPDNDPDHWDLIEGQGSLFHASYAGVSLGLLHGSQPDCLVVCHDPNRSHMRGLPGYGLPSLKECIRLNEECGRLTNPACRVVGLSINTSHLDPRAAQALLRSLEQELGLPAVDAFREGASRLVDTLPR